MPRLTRSKRVANLVHEDEVSAEEIPLPPSPDNRTDSRAPLGEIEILNLEQPAPLVVEMTEAIEAVKKSNSKEKAKGGRKGKKGKKNAVEKDIVEESRSIPEVEAVKAACEDLMNGNTRDRSRSPVKGERAITPPSPAVRATRKRLAANKVDVLPSSTIVEEDAAHVTTSVRESEKVEDSFVHSIVSRSPAKLVTRKEELSERASPVRDSNQVSTPSEKKEDDSFVEQIITRSPAKPVSRIEDSVEAIDALEDALEQVDKAVSDPVPPKEAGKAKRGVSRAVSKQDAKKAPAMMKELSKTGSNKEAVSDKSTARAVSIAARKQTVPVTHKRTVSIKAPVVTQTTAIAKKRPVSMAFPAPPPLVKSTKPPTQPNFTLPGEAISQKLKAAREARQAKEAENLQAKKQFKARPVRLSATPTVAVKATAASRARMSIVTEEGVNVVPKSHVGNGASREKRGPSLTVTKRPATTTTNAPRVASLAKRAPSTSVRPEVSAVDVAIQRQRAKEIFSRDRVEKGELERMRKEKEEAAKRARAEAAEKGRLASREWAEKQRMKKQGLAPGSAASALKVGC